MQKQVYNYILTSSCYALAAFNVNKLINYQHSLYADTYRTKQKTHHIAVCFLVYALYCALFPIEAYYCLDVCFGHQVILNRVNMGFA